MIVSYWLRKWDASSLNAFAVREKIGLEEADGAGASTP